MMEDTRKDLAQDIITAFGKHPIVRHAFLRGSLANGTADRYSDIDIGIDVSGRLSIIPGESGI